VIDAAYAPAAVADDVLRRAEGELYALTPNPADGGTLTAAEAARRVLERAERVQRREEPAGLSLGWPKLDAVSGGGLRPGQLVIVAGQTSVGKSALSLRFALNVAARAKVVKVFSAEMTTEELGLRLLAMETGINGLKIAAGRLGPEHWQELQETQQTFAAWGSRMELTDRPMTVPQMAGELRRMSARIDRPVDLAVVDYLQIIPAHDGENLRERINAVSRGLKLMAKELRLPILLLSQLSRQNQQDNRPPELHHLKESSSIEQDADGVILLYRAPDAQVDPITGNYSVQVKVGKWRNGLRTDWGDIELRFIRDAADFHFPAAVKETL